MEMMKYLFNTPMNPVDFRNATWEEIRGKLKGLRAQAYEAFCFYGPGTTREVAELSGMSLLTLRPRATELLELVYLEVIDSQGHEGVYQARTEGQCLALFEERQRAARADAAQLPLKL